MTIGPKDQNIDDQSSGDQSTGDQSTGDQSTGDQSVDGESIGYFNGSWVAKNRMRLSVTDDGFRFAATAVERLRTYGGKPFMMADHLARWSSTLDTIGFTVPVDNASVMTLIDELIQKNQSFVSRHGEVGITIFATPGSSDVRPTFGAHLNVIDLDLVQRRRNHGQPLVVTDVVQPSPKSWPRDIKVRCRLHYYLADQQARRSQPDSNGILLDEDGSITETSIANIAVVLDSKIVSPPNDRVLGGVTQKLVEAIARESAIDWTKRPIAPSELQRADGVILMGTDGGIWFCNQVDETMLSAGDVYSRLKQGFDDYVRRVCTSETTG